MAQLKILTGTTNTTLRTISLPVKKIDKKIKKLIDDMIETMLEVDGLGLAAPQVGVNKRIFVARLNSGTKNEMVVAMINPEFLDMSDEIAEGEEGCLSVPLKFGIVGRSKDVKVEYLDAYGKKTVLGLADLNARILQHETDHLNGILFVDKLEREITEGSSSF